ncbi:RNA-directed DNA polymerase, eukaryota [Tanacetum coccineum]
MESCLSLGDFNECHGVRMERWGSIFNVYGARDFNHFITSAGLVEVQLEGYSYTWAHPSASKMSKLDRFLVSDGFLSLFPHTSAVCLDRHLSDHRPILLREFNTDYGATPFHESYEEIRKLKLKDIDKVIRSNLVLIVDLLSVRSELLKQYHDIHSVETRESIQKAKIKWAVEGDENSKFFHGMINRKRRSNLAVKVGELEAHISRDENCRAVWDCGEKIYWPDGFTFEFFRKFWNIVGPDLCLAVEWFFHHASFPVGCNSSFIALIPKTLNPKSVGEYRPISLIGSIYKIVTKILANRLSTVIADIISNVQTAFLPNRQILDGPFIINELLARCHHKKHSAMVFKIDFAKAYDSIRWDYLGDVLKSFGFGVKSCAVDLEVLEAATLIGCSVLHTPFKYLGIMVGENMSSIRAWDETVNKLKMSLSSWKLKTLSIGGRLTLLKSVLGSTPIYNMSLFKVPKAVLKSMESIRRNFFNGIRDGEKKIAWVSWSKVLASKSNGGLGVSSFYALNRGLLFKWIWRFLSRDQSLWAQVIHALHGSNTSTLSASYSSLWSSIIKECNALKSQGLDLISHCKIRVGNGMSTSFWHDQWLGDSCLRLSYPRLFALENNKVCSVAAKMSAPFVSSLRRDVRGGEESAQLSRISDLLDTVVLSNMGDRRFWDLNGDGCFRVKDVRRLLDDMLLPKSDVPSRWVKQIPIKVNVLAWKISMDRLPTRVNLHRRGVQVSPISCPICCEALENLDHLLFCCDLAKDIARFNQVQNKCWKECFTLPGGVSGHIETISSSLIQIFEKMVFLKT